MDPLPMKPVLNITCDCVEPRWKRYAVTRAHAKRAGLPEMSGLGTPPISVRARILHFRLGDLERGHVRLLLQDQIEERHGLARVEGATWVTVPDKRRYFPCADRHAAGHRTPWCSQWSRGR